MTQQERLVFCKKCQNRGFDLSTGIFCKLRGKKADFENECPDFIMDEQSTYISKPKEAITPNGPRARNAQVFIWVVLGVSFISFISSYLQYGMLQDVKDGVFVSDNELTLNDLRESAIGIITLIVYITSGVVFIQWFRRAYYNLNSRSKSRFDEGWAAGAWFVPILCLFRPYQIMKEIDEDTSVLIEKKSSEPVPRNGILIGVWWALWIISNYVGQYVFKTSFNTNTVEGLIDGTMAQMVSFLFDIPLAVAAVYLIREINKKEEKLFELEKKDMVLKAA